MSTTRKIFILVGCLCIAVACEGIYSAARHFGHDQSACVVALVRAGLAFWIGSAIGQTLKANPDK